MESTSDQAAEGKAVVTVLAAVLERLVKSNASSTKSRDGSSASEVTKFHALKAPGISIKQYLERIHKYASCSTECFVLALIYIDRLIQNNNFILSDLNVHRVVITAILLAAKFFDDAYYNNAYYAKVGGVLVSEMNSLEVEFLFRINFSLHVKPEVFEKYQDELVSHAVGGGLGPQQQLCQQQQQQLPCNIVPSSQVVHQQQVPCPPVFQPVPVVSSGPAQTIIPQRQQQHPYQPHNAVVGNVTPSPPPPAQQMEYTQQHQQPHRNTLMAENAFYVPNNQTQTQSQPIQVLPQVQQIQQHQPQHRQQQQQQQPMSFERYVNQQHGLYQQQQQHQQQQEQQYPIRASNGYNEQITPKSKQNQILSSTTDVIFATCCPYGSRLTPTTSATGFINKAARIYQ